MVEEIKTPAEVRAEAEGKDAAERAAADKAAAEKAAKAEPTDPPKPSVAEDLISKAEAAAIRMEEANKVHAELLQKQEALQVEKTLSGTAEAGSKEQTKDEQDVEAAKNLLKGTGFDEQLPPILKSQVAASKGVKILYPAS